MGFAIAGNEGKEQELTTIDINPRIDRLCRGWDGVVPTLTSSSKNFILKVPDLQKHRVVNRLMLGYEALGLQGCPVEINRKQF